MIAAWPLTWSMSGLEEHVPVCVRASIELIEFGQ